MKAGLIRTWGLAAAMAVALSACVSQNGQQSPSGAPVPYQPEGTFSGLYLSADSARRNRDVARAAEYYDSALALDPDNQILLRHAMIMMLAEGRMERALELAQRRVKAEDGAAMSRIVLSTHDASRGNWFAAEKHLAAATSRGGLATFIVPLMQAWVAAAGEDTAAAEKYIDGMPDRQSFKMFRDYHRGLIRYLHGDTVGALPPLDAAMKAGGHLRPLVLRNYAAILASAGDSKKARAALVAFQDRVPLNPVVNEAIDLIDQGKAPPSLVPSAAAGLSLVFYDAALSLARERSSEAAKIYARLSLLLNPDLGAAWMLYGEMMERDGRWQAAADAYGKVGRDTAFGWEARVRIANTLARLKQNEAAIATLVELSEERPEDTDALATAGDILRYDDQFAAAAQYYEKAIARIPGEAESHHWFLYYSLARSYARNDEWERAEPHFLKSLELQPDQPDVLNYLGYSWVEKGLHLKRALRMIERAVEQRPKAGYIVDSLGWALYQMGNYEEAVVQLEKAVELLAQDPVINDHLGDAYWMVGRRWEAGFQWRHALSYKPDDELRQAIEDKLKNGLKPVTPVVEKQD